jgi:hypothetical protein
MNGKLLTALGLSLLTASEAEASVQVRAWIDGRSRIILDDDTATWQHYDYAAPGRLGCDVGLEIQPTYLGGVAWFPDWPDASTCENRDCGGCLSSTFVGLRESMPNHDYFPSVHVFAGRGAVAVVEYPNVDNGYRVVIEFDDNPWSGADWYELDVETLGSGCVANKYCMSMVNSSGQAATISAAGTLSVTNNDTRLIVHGAVPGQPGLFVYGPAPAGIPFANGYLCVNPFYPGLIRVPQTVLVDAQGSVDRWLDLQSLPPAGTIEGRSTWYFQLWFRDPAAGGARSNLSDGLQLTFCN